MVGMKYLCLFLISCLVAQAEDLFDGLSLKNWGIQAAEKKWWRVEDQAVVGGSLVEKIPHNTFITTAKKYGDFELTLEVMVTGNHPNAGIQFRSERIENHHEMIGYQCDVGPGLWGRLYDESRRRRFLVEWKSKEASQAAKEGWNRCRIRCEGSRIRIWINQILTCDFTETDPTIPLKGYIALQAHSGAPFEVRYRRIQIVEF